MSRTRMYPSWIVCGLFVTAWAAAVAANDCGCVAGGCDAGGYAGAAACGGAPCQPGAGLWNGYCAGAGAGCCLDETCGACTNLRGLGQGFWARLTGTACCGDGGVAWAGCDGCGEGGLARCNYGHGCDLLGRFQTAGCDGLGCDGLGCDGLGRGCGLFGRCACGGPGAGDPTARPVKYCGMPAPTYPVPHPVPAYVGYTYFTYPPMMPHHSLPHYRGTYSYRHAPGLSRTNVHWRQTHVINAAKKLHHVFELPR